MIDLSLCMIYCLEVVKEAKFGLQVINCTFDSVYFRNAVM